MKKTLIILFLFLTTYAQAKPLRLSLNWKPEGEFGGFYAAQLEGAFKKRSLDVEIIPGGSGSPTTQVVAAGKSEFGTASGEEVILSHSRGTDIIALFAVYQKSPMAIMVHENPKIKSLQDVFKSPGTLALHQGLPYYLYFEKKFGKPQAQVVPYLGGIGSFMRDSNFMQQAFVTSETLLAANKGIKTSVFPFSEAGFNPYLTVLIARKSFVDKNRDQVKAFVAAIKEGWRNYLDHPQKTNSLMHQLNPSMDEATLQQSADAQKPLIETEETKKNGLGSMTKERWQTLGQQLKEIGLIERAPHAEDLFINF